MRTATRGTHADRVARVLAHQGSYMEIGRAFERLPAWAAGRGLTGPATRSRYAEVVFRGPYAELDAAAGCRNRAKTRPTDRASRNI